MDETDKLIAKCFAAFFITLVLTVGGCMGYSHKRIADSSDPLAVSCAMGLSDKACVAAAAAHH